MKLTRPINPPRRSAMSMHKKSRSGRKVALILAAIVGVLTVALSGNAVADKLIGSPQIKNGSIYSPDLHDGAVRSTDVRNGGVHRPDLSPSLREQLSGSCESGAGVDFAINSNDEWKVIGNAFGEPGGNISLNDSRKAGVVQLATYPKAGYADAGVIVELGTVGSRFDPSGAFKMPNVRGPYTDQTAVNLYVDVSGNGAYFMFDHNGILQGLNGDEVLYSVNESTNRADIAGAVTDDTRLWAWVGVSGNDAQSAALTRFAGHDLAVC